MSTAELHFPQETAEIGLPKVQAKLRRLEKRDWWLWGTAIVVMLLLTFALNSLSLPVLWKHEDAFFSFNLNQSVRGLLGLVLLFSIYAFYQQSLLKRLRVELAGQVERAARAEERAQAFLNLSILDPLTDLYNRRFAEHHLPAELARCIRHGYPLTLLMLDLNYFKQVNDRYGHVAGDLALSEFARRLKKAIRSSDLPVRMGGDEFMVVLPECRPEEVAYVLARLRGLEITFGDNKIPVDFSAGWTQYQPSEPSLQLLERADQALYAQKRGRRAEDKVGSS